MTFAVVAVDVDSTLCAPHPVTTFDEWEASIRAQHPPVLPEAVREIPRILAAHPNAARVVLTARHERLADVTRAFLAGCFPALIEGTVSMQTTAEYEAWQASGESVTAGFTWSRRSKLNRLAVLRVRHPGRLLLVDDDPEMEAACGSGDVFVRAWPTSPDPRRVDALSDLRDLERRFRAGNATAEEVQIARVRLRLVDRALRGEPTRAG